MQIWVELKSYKTETDFKTKIASAFKSNVHRVQELVALLQSYKEDKVELRISVSLGYFDDGA